MLKSNLVRHKIFHTFGKTFGRTKKNFDCQICGKSFGQKITLERHILTHTRKERSKPKTKNNSKKNMLIRTETELNQSPTFEKENNIYIKIETDN